MDSYRGAREDPGDWNMNSSNREGNPHRVHDEKTKARTPGTKRGERVCKVFFFFFCDFRCFAGRVVVITYIRLGTVHIEFFFLSSLPLMPWD